MEIIDRIFIAVLARYRRRMAGRSLQQSWSAATFHVSTFVCLATVIFAVAAFVAVSRSPGELLSRPAPVYILAIVFVILIGYLVDRRFRKFLLNPPPMEAIESTQDAQLIWAFRLVAVGLFLVGCLAARSVGMYLVN